MKEGNRLEDVNEMRLDIAKFAYAMADAMLAAREAGAAKEEEQ
jgi:hypothetical protein